MTEFEIYKPANKKWLFEQRTDSNGYFYLDAVNADGCHVASILMISDKEGTCFRAYQLKQCLAHSGYRSQGLAFDKNGAIALGEPYRREAVKLEFETYRSKEWAFAHKVLQADGSYTSMAVDSSSGVCITTLFTIEASSGELRMNTGVDHDFMTNGYQHRKLKLDKDGSIKVIC